MEHNENVRSGLAAKGEGASKPRFLVFATEWFSGKGGVSTFNRELCQGLVSLGCHVTCCVESAQAEEIADAREKGVTLHCPAPDEVRVLGTGALLLPIKSAHRFDFVVGHGRVTGQYARAFVKHQSPDSRSVHFIHVAPQCIEWHKGNEDASQRAEDRKREEAGYVVSSDFSFAVGPLLRNEYATVVRTRNKQVYEFRPGLFDIPGMGSPPPVAQCLVLGRAEDLELKGLDIAARALAAINRSISCKLVVRGAPQLKGQELRGKLKALGAPSPLEIQVYEYSSDRTRILEDIQETSLLLMPSRSEGFGLVALEAISASVPVLLSARSGLAHLLVELLPNDPDSVPSIVSVTEELETDVLAWEAAIKRSIANREEAFKRAERLRSKLAEHLSWELAVQDFLDVLTGSDPPSATPSTEAPRDGGTSFASGLTALVSLDASIGTSSEIAIGHDADGVNGELRAARVEVRTARSKLCLERLDRLIRERGAALTIEQRRRVFEIEASAHLTLGAMEKATSALERAYEIDSVTADGIASGALSALVRGDQEEAHALAQRAVAVDPSCERALTVFVDSASTDAPFEELVAQVSTPGPIASGPAAALANAAEHRGMVERALEFARIAERLSTAPSLERKTQLGNLLIQYGLASGAPAPEIVKEAASVFAQAVRILEEGDQPIELGTALIQLALAHELIGEASSADRCVERALEVAPNDPVVLLRSAATFVERNRFSDALALIKRVTPQTSESRLFETEVLRLMDRGDEALNLAEAIDPSTLPTRLVPEWTRINLSILTKRKHWSAAKARVQRALAIVPSSIYLLAAAARVERQSGGDGHQFLARAMEATDGAPVHDLNFLLKELVQCELWEEAGTVMRQLGKGPGTSAPRDTHLWVAYNRGDLDEALSLSRQRREEAGLHPEFLGIEASILEEVGALSEAAALLDQGLERWPSDSHLLLRRGIVAIRQRDLQTQTSCLAKLPTHFSEQQLNEQYVFLLMSTSRFFEAARAAYELRRVHFNEAGVHRAYVQTVLRLPVDLFPEEPKAAVDSAVRIVSESQGDAWWIFDDHDEVDFGRHEIHKGSQLRRAVEGHSVGELVDVPSMGRVEIREIVSKYIHAFRESMGLFGSVLEDESIRPMRVTEQEGFAPILDAVRARSERTTSVLDLYDSGRTTVGACAAMLRVSQFEMVASMISDEARAIRCADGSQPSVAAAMSILELLPRLVCDPVSLVVLDLLGLGRSITSIFGRLLVTQSIVDLVQEGVFGVSDSRGRAHMSLHYAEGQYYRRENTEEEAAQRHDFWKRLLDFIAAYCEVAPCWGSLKLSRSSRVEHGRLLDRGSFDSVLLATEQNRVLLSDDMMLRMLAANEFHVPGVWTQVLLAMCHTRDTLTERQYAEATVTLVLSGFTFVTINSATLLVAAELDGWSPGARFRSVTRLLGAGSVQFSSAVTAATDFVAKLWTADTTNLTRDALLTVLFNALSSGRLGTTVFREVERALRIRLRLSPPALREALQVLHSWRAANLS